MRACYSNTASVYGARTSSSDVLVRSTPELAGTLNESVNLRSAVVFGSANVDELAQALHTCQSAGKPDTPTHRAFVCLSENVTV